MKKLFALRLVSVGAVFMICACSTPEERSNRAAATDSIENRSDSLSSNPPVNTDVDMDSSQAAAVMPDSVAANQKTGDSVEMQHVDRSGKALRTSATDLPEIPPALLSNFIIKYSKLVVKDKIGSGAFGDVYL